MVKLFSKKGGAGFTLIELLVVIAIIGVLASIVLASLNTARAKSRDARRITDIKQIQLALELYFDGAGAGQYAVTVATLASQYIPVEPKDPSTNAIYSYAYNTTGGVRNTYHLGASLEQTDSAALRGDRDCNSLLGTACPYSAGAYTAGGFNGGTGDPETGGTCADVSVTTHRCYDLVP